MNLFDSANYPECEPDEIIAGHYNAWKRTDIGVDYPPASYALSYTAILETDPDEKITIDASEDGSDYVVELAKATTADYKVGRYHWQAQITRSSDSEIITIDSGTFDIKADFDAAPKDPREHCEIVLEAILAVIEKRATKDQMSYSIANRSLGRMPIADLLRFRDQYRGEVHVLNRKRRIKQGKKAGGGMSVKL